MNYISAAIIYLIMPFTFNLSNIDNDTYFALKYNTLDNNTMSSKAISSGNELLDANILNTSITTPSFMLFDIYFGTQIYLSKTHNIWFEPFWEWQPFINSSSITLKSPLSQNPSTVSYYFHEYPGFGANFGWDFKKSSFYIGGKFLQIGYEAATTYNLMTSKDSVFEFKLGTTYKLSNSWNALIEYSNYTADFIGIEGQTQNVSLTYNKIKFGVSYQLDSLEMERVEQFNDTYQGIIRTLDPDIDERIKKVKKQENEEQKKAEQAAKEQAERLKQEEAQRMEQEEITSSEPESLENSSEVNIFADLF